MRRISGHHPERRVTSAPVRVVRAPLTAPDIEALRAAERKRLRKAMRNGYQPWDEEDRQRAHLSAWAAPTNPLQGNKTQ